MVTESVHVVRSQENCNIKVTMFMLILYDMLKIDRTMLVLFAGNIDHCPKCAHWRPSSAPRTITTSATNF